MYSAQEKNCQEVKGCSGAPSPSTSHGKWLNCKAMFTREESPQKPSFGVIFWEFEYWEPEQWYEVSTSFVAYLLLSLSLSPLRNPFHWLARIRSTLLDNILYAIQCHSSALLVHFMFCHFSCVCYILN